MQKLFRLTIIPCCLLALSACDDNKSKVREIIFVDDISTLNGNWYISDVSASFNPDGLNYKNTIYTETVSINATSTTRAVMSFCEKDDINVELVKNTLFQVIEAPVDEDGDGIQDVDSMGTPLTEEVFAQLFVLSSESTMLQNYTFICDTNEEVNELRCAQDEYAVGRTDATLLASNNYGTLDINGFASTTTTEINAGNTQTLDVSCYVINQEIETDGEGLYEASVKAANNDYSLILRYENLVDYDSNLQDFTETNTAWVEKLESSVSGINWTYKDAEANAPAAEHFRATDTGTFTLAATTASLTADVILSDGNEIEEENSGVTTTVGYSVNATTNLTFELPVTTE